MKDSVKRMNREIKMRLMETDTSERTREMAKQIPYHLQYVREGKPMIKPNEGTGTTNEENRTY